MFGKNKLVCVMSVVLLCAVFFVSSLFSSCDDNDNTKNSGDSSIDKTKQNDKDNEKADLVVMIDAGHGGVDPGKVGVDGQLEKDINLQIVLKLKRQLEENEDVNIKVVLTRDSDMGYYSESDSNKKMADMRKRCELVNESGADVLVSIHQNSYHSPSVKGAQVFYYDKSENGHKLATSIQAELVSQLVEKGKGRVEKANDNYYILLNVECPAVIVECGFLSNPNEAEKLSSDEYQERVARAIMDGLVNFYHRHF